MSTCYYACGCSITRSMFGDRELIDVHFCPHHIKQTKIKMEELAVLLRELINTDPGYYDYTDGTPKWIKGYRNNE